MIPEIIGKLAPVHLMNIVGQAIQKICPNGSVPVPFGPEKWLIGVLRGAGIPENQLLSTVDQVQALNPGVTLDALSAGQELCLPANIANAIVQQGGPITSCPPGDPDCIYKVFPYLKATATAAAQSVEQAAYQLSNGAEQLAQGADPNGLIIAGIIFAGIALAATIGYTAIRHSRNGIQ